MCNHSLLHDTFVCERASLQMKLTVADMYLRHVVGKVPSVWHWAPDSGLLPASVYLRHCLLAVEKAGCWIRSCIFPVTLRI